MTVTKLQIPIDQNVKDNLERRAKALGFDSAQAYIRVWAKAEADGRQLDFDSQAIRLSQEAIDRYAGLIAGIEHETAAGTAKQFTSADDLMRDLLA